MSRVAGLGRRKTGVDYLRIYLAPGLGSIAARVGWDMDSPETVYVGSRMIASSVWDESRRQEVTRKVFRYGEETLPNDPQLQETLNHLSEPDFRSLTPYRKGLVITAVGNKDFGGALEILSKP